MLKDFLESLRGPPLREDLQAPFLERVAEVNRRRLSVFLPLFAIMHVVHALIFWPSAAQRAELSADVLEFRELLVFTHLATLGCILAALALLFLRPVPSTGRVVAPAVALIYLVHGAAIVGVDMLQLDSSSVYLGYSLGVAAVLLLHPRELVVLYALGVAAFVIALQLGETDPITRAAVMPPGISISVVAVGLGTFFYLGRRRDFAQGVIIEEQQAELSELNAALEKRVEEQVSEILARADEIEALNKRLRVSVQERSADLSVALARLAMARGEKVTGALGVGAVLGDRFEVGELIGKGGMGAVYRGRDRTTGKEVALKIIQAASASELDGLHRFLAEAHTTASVRHPAVVEMLHVGVSEEGLLYQAQELVEGLTMKARLAQGSIPLALAIRGAETLCQALHAAHSAGVIHRDVKPANIMLTGSPPGLKLLDFGIAKLYDAVSDGRTQTGLVVGTPSYMAPEQVEGLEDPTDRVDVFAVGVLLYRMIAGRLPFDAPTPRQALLKRLAEPAEPIKKACPTLNQNVARLVDACLRREPARRPSALEVAEALQKRAEHERLPPLHELALEPVSSEDAPTQNMRVGSETDETR